MTQTHRWSAAAWFLLIAMLAAGGCGDGEQRHPDHGDDDTRRQPEYPAALQLSGQRWSLPRRSAAATGDPDSGDAELAALSDPAEVGRGFYRLSSGPAAGFFTHPGSPRYRGR